MDTLNACIAGWNLMALIAKSILQKVKSLRPSGIDNIADVFYKVWEKEAEAMVPYACTDDYWNQDKFDKIQEYVQTENSVYKQYILLCQLCTQWHLEYVLPYMDTSFVALNTNVEETGILIAPKYSCYFNKADDERRCYSQYTITPTIALGDHKIIHHCLDPVITEGKKMLRIAFSPLGNMDAIAVDEFVRESDEYGAEHSCMKISVKPDYQSLVAKYTARAILDSSQYNADVFLAPELLGADEITEMTKSYIPEEHQYSSWLRKLYMNREDQALAPPQICILPRCKDGINCMHIFDSTARLIATQNKLYAYTDKSNHVAEYLKQSAQITHIFHLKKVGQICIMICADYLKEEYRNLITSEMEITLVLVPSFSKGVTDFMNTSVSGLYRGTNVLWGNTCAAKNLYDNPTEPFINPIGCFSITEKRNPQCIRISVPKRDNCMNCHEKDDVCLYFLDIPLDQKSTAVCRHVTQMSQNNMD